MYAPVLSSESASSLYRGNQIARYKFRLCAVIYVPRGDDDEAEDEDEDDNDNNYDYDYYYNEFNQIRKDHEFSNPQPCSFS